MILELTTLSVKLANFIMKVFSYCMEYAYRYLYCPNHSQNYNIATFYIQLPKAILQGPWQAQTPYFSERQGMFSQVCWEYLLCKVLIASLLGKPRPAHFLQYGTLHHAATSVPQKRGEMWKNKLSLSKIWGTSTS